MNIEYKDFEIKNNYLIRDSEEKNKYFHFYTSHDHNTNECVHLKDAIEVLLKRGDSLGRPDTNID